MHVRDDTPGNGGAASDFVASAAQLACLLEVLAPKPGNVSPGRPFEDARVEHFLASAAAIGPALAAAHERPLGRTIRLAVDSTRQWSRSNTNLGMVLLLAPLARAAIRVIGRDEAVRDPVGRTTICSPPALRAELAVVLDTTTIEDAREVYAAIRTAAPGGLGRAPEQDVADEPTVTLLDAMRLAAGRDTIAGEYASTFGITFEQGAPALGRARGDGLGWEDAVVETFLTLLAAHPDSHVARRAGPARAEEVSRHAAACLDAGGVRTDAGRRTIDELDRRLRDRARAVNPGTTADLTAASLFVVLLGGGWQA